MYTFGTKSRAKLDTCHPDLVMIAEEAIKIYDFSVIFGARTTKEQIALFEDGKTTLDGVNQRSKHQTDESQPLAMAMDLMPYKRKTNAFSGHEKDDRRFYYMMGIIKAIAERLFAEGKITHLVRFGMDWDGDDTYRDQSFDDLPHVELV